MWQHLDWKRSSMGWICGLWDAIIGIDLERTPTKKHTQIPRFAIKSADIGRHCAMDAVIGCGGLAEKSIAGSRIWRGLFVWGVLGNEILRHGFERILKSKKSYRCLDTVYHLSITYGVLSSYPDAF